MDFFVLGMSHKTSPVEIRERLALTEEDYKELRSLLGSDISEVSAISTCNRVEFYYWGEEKGKEKILDFIQRAKGVSKEILNNYMYFYRGREAIIHIFRVAASLDSMVVGEPQIVAQFKEAFELSRDKGLTGPFINQLLSKALSASKKARTKTRIAESAVSVSYAAVELAEKIFGELERCTCALVGAGEMAELAAKHLKDAGVGRMIVVNRTFERAKNLAEELGGEPLSFEALEEAVLASDIVIASTAATEYILNRSQMEKVMKRRKQRPVFIIDIAVPRNIDPAVGELDNVYLYNIDDLEAVVEENKRKREKEAVKAQAIIEEEADKLLVWLRSQRTTPLIVSLREMAEQIRKSELKKTLNRLNLSEREERALEAMSSAIVNKMLHPILTYVKKKAAEGKAFEAEVVIREMFNLGVDVEDKDRNKGK